jgi:hypothetical protein
MSNTDPPKPQHRKLKRLATRTHQKRQFWSFTCLPVINNDICLLNFIWLSTDYSVCSSQEYFRRSSSLLFPAVKYLMYLNCCSSQCNLCLYSPQDYYRQCSSQDLCRRCSSQNMYRRYTWQDYYFRFSSQDYFLCGISQSYFRLNVILSLYSDKQAIVFKIDKDCSLFKIINIA